VCTDRTSDRGACEIDQMPAKFSIAMTKRDVGKKDIVTRGVAIGEVDRVERNEYVRRCNGHMARK